MVPRPRVDPCGAATFFITGRDESQRSATERNLTAVGNPGYTGLIMEPVGAQFVSAAVFKAPQRARLEDHYLLPDPFYRIP